MGIVKNQTYSRQGNHLLIIAMGALLLGFAWQIRGSGTSDPSVVAFLFLMYLSIHYGPRKKFNILVFGLISFLIIIMRAGWGTFVAQGWFPGIDLPDDAVIRIMDIKIPMGWYMGNFWLFIVGIAWFGLPSLIFGGYFFTKLNYTVKDIFIITIIFIVSKFVAGFIAEFLIPYLTHELYNEIYPAIEKRNYLSMCSNLSAAIAIIPVLLYIHYIKADRNFSKYALIAMLIFAFAISISDVWWPLLSLMGKGGSLFWSLWEYFTGFVFGGLIFWFYGRFSSDELAETDIPTGLDISGWKPFEKFVINSVALYALFFYGIADSLEGGIRLAFSAAGFSYSPDGSAVQLIVSSIGIFFYWLYFRGKIGKTFAQKSFRENSLNVMVIMLPFYYLNFILHHIISGSMFLLDWNSTVIWLDSISFVIVEVYLISFYFRKHTALIR